MIQKKYASIIIFLGDVLVAYVSLYLALTVRSSGLICDFKNIFYVFLPVYIFWLAVIFVLNLYDLNFLKKPLDFTFNIIIFSFVAVFSGMAYFYFRPDFGLTPKTILVLNVLIFDILFFLWRHLFNFVLEIRGVKEKMVIIGFKPELEEILPQINKNYDISAVFYPAYFQGQGKYQFVVPGVSALEDIGELKKIIGEKGVSSVLLATTSNDLIGEIFSNLPLRLEYIYFNDLYEAITKKVSVKYLDEAWFLEKISRPEDRLEQVIKRLFDIFFSLIGSVLLVVFLPFIALAIKIDSKGGVFFTQRRPGKDGELFTIYKFRTLTDNPKDSGLWREKKGANITRVGKFLRKSHLDELPQAWNILKGDMSFVGPRPEPLEHAKIFENEIPFYMQRYLIKPGLLGWAQINFKASKSVQEGYEKFEYDLYYIKNRSILFDIEIVLKAVKLFLW